MKRLEQKVAIITGAAMGQGAAEAYLFAKEGAKVIAADLAMEELEKLEDERRKSPVLGKRGVPKGIANTEMWTFLIVNISSL